MVLGVLCILQLVYSARKRRLIRAVCHKANVLRNHMMEHHHHSQEHKSTPDLNNPKNAVEYLIYNLNRNALCNTDQINMTTPNANDLDNPSILDKHLKVPNRLKKHSIIPLAVRRRSLVTTSNKNFDSEEDVFDESDFDTRSYEEQSSSFKSVSHILEENKPWMAKLIDDGSIQHAVLSSKHIQNTRLQSL
jgi:hypothetical protein